MTHKLIGSKNDISILPVPSNEKPTMATIFEYLVQSCDSAYAPHPMLLSMLAELKKSTSKKTTTNIKKLLHKTHSYSALSTLYEARILGNIISPLKKIINLPQFDGYHTYAVDEHSIRAVLAFESMTDGFLVSIYEDLSSDEKAMLKLVVLLHDAGKGREKDHSEIGVLLFRSFASKLGIESDLIKTGELLILNHTLMSRVAQREDLYNEQIVMKFVSRLKDKKTIDMLFLLTIADISAVGSGVLSSFTIKLLKTLYDNSLQALNNNELLSDTAKRVKKENLLKKSENFNALEPKEQASILSIQSNLPFLRYKVDEIIAIGKMAFDLNGDYKYKITNDDTLRIEIVRATSLQLGYLLGRLSHIEVANMEICKLFNGLKYFKIEYNTKITDGDMQLLDEIIKNSFDPEKTINIKKPEILAKEIEIDCDYSSAYASMKLNTKDQKGLLAYIANLFDELGVDIESAKLHSIKNRTRDTFLIQKNGNFCHNTELILNKLTENI
jgi:[protein-PII] uridylyltransferase